MPLTAKGTRAMKGFRSHYGKTKGTSVFHAYTKGHPEKTSGWHKGGAKKR